MKANIFFSALALSVTVCYGAAFAQCDKEVWPSDPELKKQAEEKLALYQNANQSQNFKGASIAATWLAQNAPLAKTNFLNDAAKTFDKLAQTEKDAVRKKKYVDSLLIIHDLRAKYCGEITDALNARALVNYKYYVAGEPHRVLEHLDSLLRQQGVKASDPVIVAYMVTVKAVSKKYRKLTDDQIIGYYNRAMGIADAKHRNAKRRGISEEASLRLKDDIDALLLSMIVIDCNFIKNNLGPRFRQYPDDLTFGAQNNHVHVTKSMHQ